MFKKEQSVGVRIWHWLNSFCLFLLLTTVILRKTFLGRGNINIILNKAQEVGAVVTEPQSKEIARAIRNQMWQWHPIIGFVAIGLLIFRLFIYFQNKSVENKNDVKPLIFKIIKKTHHAFYLALAVMGLTGSALYWEETLGLSKNINNNIQEVHEALQWFFVLFILSHIIGVIKAEFTEDKGLISDMINGGK
jgi:cytochrome b561